MRLFRGMSAMVCLVFVVAPCLIIHGLKLGDGEGGVGLWMGQDTEGYFKDLKITE